MNVDALEQFRQDAGNTSSQTLLGLDRILPMELHPLALGAIIAAAITGILSVLGLVISKEQKTSEFRQQWIDSLRSEVAELLACVEAIRLYGSAQLEASRMQHARGFEQLTVVSRGIAGELGYKAKENIKEAMRLCYQIRLRVNPEEHRAIIDIFDQLQPKIIKDDLQGLQQLEEQLMAETQQVLRNEWKRVKAGEPMFQVAKYGALIIVAISFIAAILALTSSAIRSTSSAETPRDISKLQQKSGPNKPLNKDAEPPSKKQMP